MVRFVTFATVLTALILSVSVSGLEIPEIEKIGCGIKIDGLEDALKGIDLKDPMKLGGQVFATGVTAFVPSDANHAACEELGYMDEQFKTGDTKAANTGIWGWAKSLATTFIPNRVLRQACITMGFYHPKEEVKAAETAAAAETKEEPAKAEEPKPEKRRRDTTIL